MKYEVNFYLTPEDAILVQSRLSEIVPVKILHSRSPTQDPQVVDSLDHREAGKQWLSLFLVREEDLNDVVMHYVDVQDYWTVDDLRSPVIEFTCSFFDNDILRRGRAYYVEGYHEQDQGWIEKSAPFKAWAKIVLDTIKKSLNRRMSDYIGPSALSWSQVSGGKLVSK
ncbi:MAG TPA: hypothetical protein VKK79_05945 [Candidatus Lokiarchaeia archaeon]|nr:hypothetical protein [Candidatus Lokiarchaeia archaeon]